MVKSSESRALARVAALSIGAGLGLLVSLGALLVAGPVDTAAVGAMLSDDYVRELALEHLVEEGTGIWDSHPDAAVGKLIQPNHRVEYRGAAIRSNKRGMRGGNWRIPKPSNTVRVVLLGDSYVFGYGVEEKDRLGNWLQRHLGKRQEDHSVFVECLSLAIPSWNIVSEVSFLRRQLTELDPDLVVHVVVPNDLSDVVGVRGFGAAAAFSPQYRERCDGYVEALSKPKDWGVAARTPLALNLDHESRIRYAEANRHILRLAAAIEARGGRYLVVARFAPYLSVARDVLLAGLEDRQIAFVSNKFTMNRDHWVAAGDRHFSPLACDRLAAGLYGLAVERELLPQLQLPAWEEGALWAREIHEAGRADAERSGAFERLLAEFPLRSTLDFTDPTLDVREVAGHVYAGIAPGGLLAPYASLVLVNSGNTLGLEGLRLGARELAGGVARVFVDEFEVAALDLQGDASRFSLSAPLPEPVRGRSHVNVRIESDDWIYRFDESYRCVSLVLTQVGIVSTRQHD